MKKIFFMAVSAVLLAAGCQKTEIQNEVLPKIGFDTHVGKLTKAEDSTVAKPDAENPGRFDNLQAQGFMVWGYFATAGDLNYNLYDLYLGTTKTKEVEVPGEDGSTTKENVTTELGIEVNVDGTDWTTNGVYYWPGKRKELDLYAVSLWDAQKDEEDNSVNTYAANVKIEPADYKLEINNFVVNNDADDDLMVAPLIRQDQDDDEIVAPQFQHALAKVLVKFTTNADAETPVYVKNVSLTNVTKSGSLTVQNELHSTPESGATTSDVTLTWTKGASTTNYTAVYNAALNDDLRAANGIEAIDKQTNTTGTYNGVVPLSNNPITFGSWLLIPQVLTSDVKLVVDYIIDGNYISTTFDLVTDVKTDTWKEGMQTTYNVKIAPEYISFTPTVGEWENDYPEDRGDYDYEPVEATVVGETTPTTVTLYYVGTLAVDTKVFVKDNNNKYTAAPNNVYAIATTEYTVENGRITKIRVVTPEQA